MNAARIGKIARLPKTIRDELNRRLADGEVGRDLVNWLNGLPEGQTLLQAEFDGRPISEQNLSEWRAGGYQDWTRQQEALELLQQMSSETLELQAAVAGPVSDQLGLWLAARYAVAARRLAGAGENRELEWQKLRELCEDVVALRRGDHSAARLKLEQERLERERQQTEEGLIEHFEQWAANQKVRDELCGNHVCAEERKRRLRLILAGPPHEWKDPDESANGNSHPVAPNRSESQ